MIPQINTQVRILFKTGSAIEGTIVVWDSEVVLKTKSGYLTIQNPAENIMAYESAHLEQEQEIEHAPQIEQPVYAGEIELPTYEPDAKLRVMGLAKLRQQKIKEEKERAKQHLTRFRPDGGLAPTEYTSPFVRNK